MITPVIVVSPRNNPKCPSCHNDENIKRVCRHCGYEYVDNMNPFIEFLIFLITAIIIIWIIVTLMIWLDPNTNDSLLDILKDQWEWISSKKLY